MRIYLLEILPDSETAPPAVGLSYVTLPDLRVNTLAFWRRVFAKKPKESGPVFTHYPAVWKHR